MNYLVRRIRPDDWQELRRSRLEALKDSPLAFVEQYDDAAALSDADWQKRATSSATGPTGARFVAVEKDERIVAVAGAFRELDITDHVSVMVVGVYTTPTFRGTGAAQAVTTAAVHWAGTEAVAERIRLFVADLNEREKSFYRRIGFAETGETIRYPPDPAFLEVEMAISGLSAS